jgi:DNA-binding NarL/FixJ family response regulator
MLRILLADDHDVVRRGLRDQLSAHEGWEICGEAADGRQAVKLASKLAPDVAVIDLSMPGLNGLEATRQIRRESPRTEILIFTMHETEQLIREVLSAGARGYAQKQMLGATSLKQSKRCRTANLFSLPRCRRRYWTPI